MDNEPAPTEGRVGFSIGGLDRETLRVTFQRRENGKVGDFWDDNWLEARLRGDLGGFRFVIPGAYLRAEEVRDFRLGLERLRSDLSGEARLSSLKEWIELTVTGDGSSRLAVAGFVTDRPGWGNTLRFTIPGWDQSFLSAVITDLENVGARFPVLGGNSD